MRACVLKTQIGVGVGMNPNGGDWGPAASATPEFVK